MFPFILVAGFFFIGHVHCGKSLVELNILKPLINPLAEGALHQLMNGSVFLEPSTGETVRSLPFPNSMRTYKLRGNETGGLFTIMEGRILIGEGPQLHVHHFEDETFRVISGQLQFIIGNQTFCARAGSIVYGRKGVPMAFRNMDSPDAYIQLIFTPAGIEKYFAKVSVIYNTEPYDDDKATAIAKEFGMDMLGMPTFESIGCVTVQKNNAPSNLVSLLLFLVSSSLFSVV
jgi:mannose-6-phosphate isomerase-like protein (cupin superfamily)